jgi:hypothetical protein
MVNTIGQSHSLEQVCDGMIQLIIKNAGARTVLTADVHAGDTVVTVNNTFHFKDSDQIVFMDLNEGHLEYNSILKTLSTTQFSLVNPLTTNFIVSDTATLQKALGNVTLPENAVLFGDREVIPNPELTITVDPVSMNQVEWMYLRGGLSLQYNLDIRVYAKLDTNDTAIRVVQKYGDYLFDLLVNNLHLDIVNDEVFLTSNVSAGTDTISIPDTTGWPVDLNSHRYEVQDNNSTTLRLDRNLLWSYTMSDKALFRRRVRYIWNALVPDIEYGFIQKGSQMYKACKLTWWGKEVNEIQFPQRTGGGIT